MIRRLEKYHLKIIFLIYLISNIPLLLNINGLYWDDWAYFYNSFETLHNATKQSVGLAAFSQSIPFYFISSLDNGILIFRIITFFTIFLNGYFVYKILNTVSFFKKEDSKIIMLIFVISPLYSAKISIIDFQYTLYSFIFYFAFFLLSKFINSLTIFNRLIILSLFFISFFTNSILVFYMIVLIYIFFIKYQNKNSFFINIKNISKNNFDFILLPVLFFIIKSIWFKPNGLFGLIDYNAISINKMINPKYYIDYFSSSFFEPLLNSLSITSYLLVVFVFVPLILFFKKYDFNNRLDFRDELIIFIFGIIAFILATMPYIAVGKITDSSIGFLTRYEVLIPLSFSLLIYYGIRLFFNNSFHKYIIIFLIISFSLFNIKEQLWFNKDWYYQLSIKENLKELEIVKNNTTFIVKDNLLKDKLHHGRNLSFFEMGGMTRNIFGNDNRFFVLDVKHIELFTKYKNYKQYNFSSWIEAEPIFITLEDNVNSLFNQGTKKSLKYLLKLKYLELTNEEEFLKEIKTLVEIETIE